jgi:hypothetical protein
MGCSHTCCIHISMCSVLVPTAVSAGLSAGMPKHSRLPRPTPLMRLHSPGFIDCTTALELQTTQRAKTASMQCKARSCTTSRHGRCVCCALLSPPTDNIVYKQAPVQLTALLPARTDVRVHLEARASMVRGTLQAVPRSRITL